jgi:hypothetical protein
MSSRPEFMTEFINAQLNSTEAPVQWENCTVIPLYKMNKMGKIDEPSSFRSVVLQESTMKLVETVWVQQNNALIQSLIGEEQNA